jgi:hypothetical protein
MVRFSVFGHVRFHDRGLDPFQSTIALEQRHFLYSPTILVLNSLRESATAHEKHLF